MGNGYIPHAAGRDNLECFSQRAGPLVWSGVLPVSDHYRLQTRCNQSVIVMLNILDGLKTCFRGQEKNREKLEIKVKPSSDIL